MALPANDVLVEIPEKQVSSVKDLLNNRQRKNPFLNTSEIKVLKKKHVTRTVVEDVYYNDIEEESYKIIPVEVDEFTKVYQVKKFNDILKFLTPQGCRILLYLQGVLPHDQDYVEIQRSKVGKVLDVHPNTVSLGIQSLLDQNIICKRGKTDYWINPLVLFNGNRLQYFKKNAPTKINYVIGRDQVKELHEKGKTKKLQTKE